jgi:hypothetical protein
VVWLGNCLAVGTLVGFIETLNFGLRCQHSMVVSERIAEEDWMVEN